MTLEEGMAYVKTLSGVPFGDAPNGLPWNMLEIIHRQRGETFISYALFYFALMFGFALVVTSVFGRLTER